MSQFRLITKLLKLLYKKSSFLKKKSITDPDVIVKRDTQALIHHSD